MQIETQRLLIRDIKPEDEIPFVEMAADGSLNDCGFDSDCGSWMTKWIAEAKDFALRDNPAMDYLAYTITLKDEPTVIGSIGSSYYEDLQETGITYFIGAQYRNNGYALEAVKAYTEYFLKHYQAKRMIATIRDENIPSWKVIEKAGFILTEKRMYKDLNDGKKELYRFYEISLQEKMRTIIEQILPLWGIENRQLSQIYSSAWEINHDYVLKVYDNKERLERNIKISEVLLDCAIPVAKTVPTKTGEKYVEYKNIYFFITKKLQGSNISDKKDKTIAWKMGCAIAQLHTAFIKCEKELEFWDNSLLKEMKGWIRGNLINSEWNILCEEEYTKTLELLESVYDYLPKQLIHRDVHYENFLFFEGSLSGYIDFDLSQKNIRIFDICYFLAGLLSEETDNAFTESEWIESVKSVIAGYESIIHLSEKEKDAIPCVMECIEILFIAYFIGVNDTKHANDAYNVFRFIQKCESDIKNMI